MTTDFSLDVTTLSAVRRALASGIGLSDFVLALDDHLKAVGRDEIWILRLDRDALLRRAARIEQRRAAGEALPLLGVPFAVKDNIDVAGLPTTAGCPAYSYTPAESAFVVQRLEQAGALLVGKTNMDQFATGLVGTRSPHGACRNVFDPAYISGGSSSGSGVAVAAGLVTFSLGTDTAGSGRVPAAFGNIVGLKATRGRVSIRGVVPACRSLDCVTIFATNVEDAWTVFETAGAYDPDDPFARPAREGVGRPNTGLFRFGVPPRAQLEFFGDTAANALYGQAVARAESIGGQAVEIDFAPFRDCAQLLYGGAWVAERAWAVGDFIEAHPDEVDPTVRGIVSAARAVSAQQAFEGFYKLAEYVRAAEAAWRAADLLLLPTTGSIYTIDQVAADPVRLNTNLGYYTNFVNLMDLAALAVPAGFRPNGLPFGVSLIAPSHADRLLADVGRRYESANASKS